MLNYSQKLQVFESIHITKYVNYSAGIQLDLKKIRLLLLIDASTCYQRTIYSFYLGLGLLPHNLMLLKKKTNLQSMQYFEISINSLLFLEVIQYFIFILFNAWESDHIITIDFFKKKLYINGFWDTNLIGWNITPYVKPKEFFFKFKPELSTTFLKHSQFFFNL